MNVHIQILMLALTCYVHYKKYLKAYCYLSTGNTLDQKAPQGLGSAEWCLNIWLYLCEDSPTNLDLLVCTGIGAED